ncbi:MAG TPA: hypothetical protein VH593_05125, partial [Ktedonobacteraceae bacterium]
MIAHTTRTVLSQAAEKPASKPSSSGRRVAFISFSEEDAQFFAQLKLFLTPFERSGEITTWDPTKIQPGAIKDVEIAKALNSA